MVVSDQFSNHSHVMGGTWTLPKTASLSDAEAFAQELLVSKMGPNLLDVHVIPRDSRKEKRRPVIGFKFRMETPGERAHSDYFHAFKGMFEKRFGEGSCDWSVTSPVHVIKHTEMTKL